MIHRQILWYDVIPVGKVERPWKKKEGGEEENAYNFVVEIVVCIARCLA